MFGLFSSGGAIGAGEYRVADGLREDLSRAYVAREKEGIGRFALLFWFGDEFLAVGFCFFFGFSGVARRIVSSRTGLRLKISQHTTSSSLWSLLRRFSQKEKRSCLIFALRARPPIVVLIVIVF